MENTNDQIKHLTATDSKPPVRGNFRVNVLHGGKEKWKYCKTIERAKHLQKVETEGGLHSIIYQKIGNRYVPLNGS